MKKVGLVLIVIVLISAFTNTSYAKSTYISAGQAAAIEDTASTDPGRETTFGFGLDDEYDESLDKYVLVKDGYVSYTISDNKIKKLYVYGDSKDGDILVNIMKINNQTGAFEWMLWDVEQGFEDQILDFSSGKVQVVDSTIKKSEKETWAVVVFLGIDDEKDESPIIYGIKYKS